MVGIKTYMPVIFFQFYERKALYVDNYGYSSIFSYGKNTIAFLKVSCYRHRVQSKYKKNGRHNK